MTARDRGGAIAAVTAVGVLATFVAGKAARDAIVLEHFDVRVLPWLVGGAAVASLPLVLAVGRALARFGPRRIVPLLQVASAVVLVADWLVLRAAPRAGAVALYLHLSVIGSVLVSGFWSFITERFDARVARRHIGRIGFGATLGGIAGGAIAERTGAYATTDAIVPVIAVLQLACAAALAVLARGAAGVAHRAAWPSLATVARHRLLRTLAVVVALGSIAATALDFELKAEVAASGHSVLRLLAAYYAIASVVTAIVQLAIGRELIAWIGVPRSIAALPLGVVAAAVAALAVPSLIATALARGVELVIRSSIYRAAYELLYAPLAEEHKRPTKVVIDVGADRIGDLVGAQLVALVIHAFAVPRAALLVLAALAGVAGLVCALRLRARYAEALEQSLLLGRDAGAPAVDHTMISLFAAAPAEPRPVPHAEPAGDALADRLSELRSGDPERTRRALAADLAPELVLAAIPLLAWDAVADAAGSALRAIAPRNTGALADALLDPQRAFAIRRRVAPILAAGQPALAAWALWRGLDDGRFEVRYRCGRALAGLHGGGAALGITRDAVFDAVKRELANGAPVGPRLLDRDGDDAAPLDRILARRSSHVLRHVFALLGLVLPTGALEVALQAISTDQPSLHATALEYLETVLPAEVQAAMAKLLDREPLAGDLAS